MISLQVNVLAILDTQEPHATLVTLTTTEQVMELALHRYKESFTKIQISSESMEPIYVYKEPMKPPKEPIRLESKESK